MKRDKVNRNTFTVEFGKYEEELSHGSVILKTKAISTIKEIEFYRKFLELKNVIAYTKVNGEILDITLTPCHMELMAYIMTLDMNFEITWKRNSQQLKDLAKALNRSTASIYKSYTVLKEKRYFITTEDKLVIPNSEINNLRSNIKKSIDKNGHASFDVNFQFCVGNG